MGKRRKTPKVRDDDVTDPPNDDCYHEESDNDAYEYDQEYEGPSTDWYPKDAEQINLEKLKSSRDEVDNWQIEEERIEFVRRLEPWIADWKEGLPDLRDIFRPKEIELILETTAKNERRIDKDHRDKVIDFVARCGYKSRLRVDRYARPLLFRTTAVHWAARAENTFTMTSIVANLLKIYGWCNYRDESSGLTHFHAACVAGCEKNVAEFLEWGQVDANFVWQETGDSPLHLALRYGRADVTRLLLRRGADMTLVNKEGETPLHVVCKRGQFQDGNLVKMLFAISCENRQQLQMDAVDKWGRTPLQWAVASLAPKTVDALLDRGADLTGFVFPTEDYFGKNYYQDRHYNYRDFKLIMASGALSVIERLEARGYRLDRRGATTVMNLFAEHGLFERSGYDRGRYLPHLLFTAKRWRSIFEKSAYLWWAKNERFLNQSKEIRMKVDLSLHDYIQLPAEKATKLPISYEDCFLLERFSKFYWVDVGIRKACVVHLCEKLARGFFRRWALESLRLQFPDDNVESRIKYLTNEGLWRICSKADLVVTPR
ncbi:hypothetical protein TKK_0004746 [Trichogramma kaykai]